VLSHLRLVVAVSRNYLGYGLPQADLIQEGNIGLMKAVHRFDPERGVRLVSFALHWIRAEIHEHVLRNWRLVKIATTKAQRKLFFNLRSMKRSSAALTHSEAGEIATKLGVKPEEVLEMETRISGGDVSLDPAPGDEESVTPIAYLADSDDEPAQILERVETATNRSEGLRTAMAQLDERSRRIIEARWLRDDDDAATLQQLADEYGVSAERIRQIESKALKTMRSQMATLQ
jgi:RNA polymerase sigma-32 factor